MGLLCNDDFTNAICYYLGTLGYVAKPTLGVYTDIGALRSINKTAQMFYMSCGYYNEHSEGEYLIPSEFNYSIDKAKKIIEYVNEHPEVIKPFVPEAEKPIEKIQTTHSRFPDYMDDDYEEYYCPKCDEYLTERDLFHDKCPICGNDVMILDEFK